MKTKYKYIYFEQVGMRRWYCRNNKSHVILGTVTYYPPWKQYVIEFEKMAIFNNGCLLDVADFLSNINKSSMEKKAI